MRFLGKSLREIFNHSLSKGTAALCFILLAVFANVTQANLESWGKTLLCALLALMVLCLLAYDYTYQKEKEKL